MGFAKFGTYSLDSVLNFGKHRGKRMRAVIQDDPAYIVWATSEKMIELDNIAFDTFQRRLEQS